CYLEPYRGRRLYQRKSRRLGRSRKSTRALALNRRQPTPKTPRTPRGFVLEREARRITARTNHGSRICREYTADTDARVCRKEFSYYRTSNFQCRYLRPLFCMRDKNTQIVAVRHADESVLKWKACEILSEYQHARPGNLWRAAP